MNCIIWPISNLLGLYTGEISLYPRKMGDETKTSYEKPFKTMPLDRAFLSFAIILVLTGVVKTSPAENKVMHEQRAVQQQIDPNGMNMKDLVERLKMLEEK